MQSKQKSAKEKCQQVWQPKAEKPDAIATPTHSSLIVKHNASIALAAKKKKKKKNKRQMLSLWSLQEIKTIQLQSMKSKQRKQKKYVGNKV